MEQKNGKRLMQENIVRQNDANFIYEDAIDDFNHHRDIDDDIADSLASLSKDKEQIVALLDDLSDDHVVAFHIEYETRANKVQKKVDESEVYENKHIKEQIANKENSLKEKLQIKTPDDEAKFDDSMKYMRYSIRHHDMAELYMDIAENKPYGEISHLEEKSKYHFAQGVVLANKFSETFKEIESVKQSGFDWNEIAFNALDADYDEMASEFEVTWNLQNAAHADFLAKNKKDYSRFTPLEKHQELNQQFNDLVYHTAGAIISTNEVSDDPYLQHSYDEKKNLFETQRKKNLLSIYELAASEAPVIIADNMVSSLDEEVGLNVYQSVVDTMNQTNELDLKNARLLDMTNVLSARSVLNPLFDTLLKKIPENKQPKLSNDPKELNRYIAKQDKLKAGEVKKVEPTLEQESDYSPLHVDF